MYTYIYIYTCIYIYTSMIAMPTSARLKSVTLNRFQIFTKKYDLEIFRSCQMESTISAYTSK